MEARPSSVRSPNRRLGAELDPVERLFVDKYFPGVEQMGYDGRHAWLCVTPSAIRSWDFRKI